MNKTMAGLHRWRNITRILCDQNAPVMTKGMILRTVVRPAIKWRLPTEHISAASGCGQVWTEGKTSRLR